MFSSITLVCSFSVRILLLVLRPMHVEFEAKVLTFPLVLTVLAGRKGVVLFCLAGLICAVLILTRVKGPVAEID